MKIIFAKTAPPPLETSSNNFMNYIATTTYNYNASGTLISATTDYSYQASSTPAIYNGFTAGEIVIFLFLFWTMMFLITNWFYVNFIKRSRKKD